MEDDYIDDDFGRKPGARIDYDAAMTEIVREMANTPNDVLAEQDAQARAQFFGEGIAKEILGNEKSAIVVEDPEDLKRIEKAIREDAETAAKKAAEKATNPAQVEVPVQPVPGAPTPDAAADASTGGTHGTVAAESLGEQFKKQDAEKPTSLEVALAGIRANGERQRRLVISGDPAVERRFYEKLAERRELFYQGGTPIITVNRKKAMEILQQVAKEVHGTNAVHALNLKLNRDMGGVLGQAKMLFARKHSIDVVLVGKPEVIEAKKAELGKLVTELERKGYLTENQAPVAGGKLVVPEDGPVKLQGNAFLSQVTSDARDKVAAHAEQVMDRRNEVRDFREQKEIADMQARKEKASDASSPNGPEAISAYAVKLVQRLEVGFKDPGLLHLKSSKGQVEAMGILHQAKSYQDPTVRELQSLPDSERQKTFVQLAALVEKVANKEFGPKVVSELDTRLKDTSSVRQKVDAYLTMEAARDPAFAEKSALLIQDLVDRKILDEKQGAAVSEKIATAVAAANAPEKAAQAPVSGTESATQAADAALQKTAEQAPAQATAADSSPVENATAKPEAEGAPKAEKSAEATTAPAAEQKDSLVEAKGTQDVAPTAEKSDAPASVLDAKATPPQQELFPESQEGMTAPAPADDKLSETDAPDASRAASARAPEKDPAVPPQAVVDTSSQETTAPLPEPSPPNTAKVQDSAAQPTTDTPPAPSPQEAANQPDLHARVEALIQAGPGNLTSAQAQSLVSELDAARTKQLASLDAGSGDKSTQTLVRAESLLKELESGRFGNGLVAQAKDLAEPLQKWAQQDESRFAREGAEGLARREAVISEIKSADAAWHPKAPEPTAQQQGQQAALEVSAPAARQEPEKVPAPAAPPAPTITPEKEQLWATERAGAELARMMANPPGTFTHKDKSWNQENIQRAAQEVLKLNPASLEQLSSAQRTKAAVFSAWLADKAHAGQLPGFTSSEGRELANNLVKHAHALMEKMDASELIPADARKNLDKADRMVDSKLQLEKAASIDRVVVQDGPKRGDISSAAASALADDMIKTVFQDKQPNDAQVKYLLKNAARLTPDAVHGMAPEDKAKLTVAMSHLALEARKGSLGDFSKLPSAIQKHVHSATKAAETLHESLEKDTSQRSDLNQAYNELYNKGAKASTGHDSNKPAVAPDSVTEGVKSVSKASAKMQGREMSM